MKRSCGVLMHISSLPGEYGSGSFGKEAYAFVDFLAKGGFSVWQTLPFCLPDEFGSPYKSYSAFSVNPYFIDLPSLMKEGLLTGDELVSAKQNTPYTMEYKRLSEDRYFLLECAANRFKDWEKVDDCLQKHPKTDAFCRFMAHRAAHSDKPFYEWDEESTDENVYRTWRFICYIFLKQWGALKRYANDKGIKILGDIPIYVAFDSADVWENPEQFLLDPSGHPTAVAGVPPDYFSEDGQLWGNPLYNWRVMAKDNFAWWRERMAFMCELFDGVRIDHFRAIASYFSIPADAVSAKSGKWMKGPGMSFVRAMREAAGDTLLIAEDLGDITPDVTDLLRRSGLPGMRVLQFGFLGDSESLHLPHNYPENTVAYTGTHDNNTLLGFVWELSDTERRHLLDYVGFTGERWDSPEGYGAIIRTMYASHASFLILPIQDLLLYGSDTRLNTPGKPQGNWSYRVTSEQLASLDAEKFLRLARLYGRA